jgi:hypothetical protein
MNINTRKGRAIHTSRPVSRQIYSQMNASLDMSGSWNDNHVWGIAYDQTIGTYREKTGMILASIKHRLKHDLS